MNYQKTIYHTYAFESLGYALAAYSVVALAYGIRENDSQQFNTGVVGIMSGFSSIAMSRIIRSSAREISETVSSSLEAKVGMTPHNE